MEKALHLLNPLLKMKTLATREKGVERQQQRWSDGDQASGHSENSPKVNIAE
jgi:hypothetical protein